MSTGLDFSLDGDNASAVGFESTDFPKPLLPPQEQQVIELSGMPGAKQDSKKFKSYLLPIKGILIADSPEGLTEAIEDLKYFLYSDSDRKLILSNQSDRYRNAQYLDQEEVLREATTVELLLKFTCNDPFAYAVEQDDIDEIAITDKGHQWNIPNEGQHYAYPIITITFNQNQNHIYIKNNNIENCRFDISKAFLTNDVLVIDSKEISVYFPTAGVYSPAGIGDGGLGMAIPIILRKGTNLLEIGTTDGSLKVDVNVKFNKVYF